MEPLTQEQWLNELVANGFMTNRDYLDLIANESGANRELDFDLEEFENKFYQQYLDNLRGK